MQHYDITETEKFGSLWNSKMPEYIGECALKACNHKDIYDSYEYFTDSLGNLFCTKENRINPLIGNAGVSAVPDAARVSQNVGREFDPHNHLLPHAMAPNVAGVIGSAVAAGVLLTLFG